MASIAYLVPGVGLDTDELQRRERIANDLVADDVSVVEAGGGPLSIESSVEDEWSAVGLLQLLEEREDEFDGFVIGCFGDPGLHGLRELTDKPVVGPANASFHTAAMLADRFSCITILETTKPLTRRLVHHYGLDGRLASVPVVEAPVLEIDHSSDALIDDMVATGRRAVEEDGAEALVPGCMSLSFMQVHEEIADRVGVPFIDPVTVGLETASTWARHGISHSDVTYPSANREKLGGLFGEPAMNADD
ncbi:aspartate/glutamate racemase family protein [Natrialbaceae archaeon A-chndr2]